MDGKCLGLGHLTALRPGLEYWRHNLLKQFKVAGPANDVSFEQRTWSPQGENTFIFILPVTAIPILVTDDLYTVRTFGFEVRCGLMPFCEPLKLKKVAGCIEPKTSESHRLKRTMTEVSHFLPTVLFPSNHL